MKPRKVAKKLIFKLETSGIPAEINHMGDDGIYVKLSREAHDGVGVIRISTQEHVSDEHEAPAFNFVFSQAETRESILDRLHTLFLEVDAKLKGLRPTQ